MKNKSIACGLSRVTRLKICHMLGNGPVLIGAEQYFSRNLSEVSVCLNEYRQDLLIFPSGISADDLNHFSTIQTIDHLFRFLSFRLVANLATIF